jgi:hypothetical protein
MATNTERAILAGGCFWGMQQLIRRRPGVLSTRVGYSGTMVNDRTGGTPWFVVIDPAGPGDHDAAD